MATEDFDEVPCHLYKAIVKDGMNVAYFNAFQTNHHIINSVDSAGEGNSQIGHLTHGLSSYGST